ncbi:response regulator [Sediminibacterium ginsengisoli]|uniref:Response regulator receiver domain-containing protein n=1 Tax=Sediminibacterium ginsengisoli TaxID=413434 RepID=A0A1T4QCL2_9BACT|nr:response regulator [Sediminibacterium ginsengisoli]SKA01479.1 Response regulator receiver domain-containing protein [Sediminibacterium ginsengisoli]
MKKIENILLIDDDTDDIEIFREAVGEVVPDAHFDGITNCEKALSQLNNSLTGLPDLIFLDLNMPLINGKQCLSAMRKMAHLSNIPIIIYSTSSFQKDIDETKQLGASEFLTKSSRFEETCNLLKRMISKFTA